MNWFKSILEEIEMIFWVIKRRIHDFFYYLKCALFKKYNRIVIRTLPPTWIDKCDLLPHAMFQILEDFVKKECSPGVVSWDADEEHKSARKKMDELLNWWHSTFLEFDPYKDFDESKSSKNHYIKEIDEEGRVIHRWHCNEYESEFYKRVGEAEDEMSKELNKKLKEIVDLQPWLWT